MRGCVEVRAALELALQNSNATVELPSGFTDEETRCDFPRVAQLSHKTPRAWTQTPTSTSSPSPWTWLWRSVVWSPPVTASFPGAWREPVMTPEPQRHCGIHALPFSRVAKISSPEAPGIFKSPCTAPHLNANRSKLIFSVCREDHCGCDLRRGPVPDRPLPLPDEQVQIYPGTDKARGTASHWARPPRQPFTQIHIPLFPKGLFKWYII